jgi:predicted  nucleic acid-binding Zn-ribbon protein
MVEKIKWTKSLLEAAALEIVSRQHPLDGRVKDGIPREAIIARLQCELDHVKRYYKKLEAEHRDAEGKIKEMEKQLAESAPDAKAELLKSLPTLKSLKSKQSPGADAGDAG